MFIHVFNVFREGQHEACLDSHAVHLRLVFTNQECMHTTWMHETSTIFSLHASLWIPSRNFHFDWQKFKIASRDKFLATTDVYFEQMICIIKISVNWRTLHWKVPNHEHRNILQLRKYSNFISDFGCIRSYIKIEIKRVNKIINSRIEFDTANGMWIFRSLRAEEPGRRALQFQ